MNLMEAVHYAEYLQHFPPYSFHTVKSFSEVLILASTNPQYDERLFMVIPCCHIVGKLMHSKSF